MQVGDSFKFLPTDTTYTIHKFVDGVYPGDVAVLFTNQEMVELNTLESSGYFVPVIEASTLKLNNLKLKLLRDISVLPIKDKLYWTTQIENCKDIKLAQSLVEGLKRQLADDAEISSTSVDKRTWLESDLVPNPR